MTSPSTSQQVCTFFQLGRCTFGDTCRNLHLSRARCIFFAIGRCTKGDSCTFTHSDQKTLAVEPNDAEEARKSDPSSPVSTTHSNSDGKFDDHDEHLGEGPMSPSLSYVSSPKQQSSETQFLDTPYEDILPFFQLEDIGLVNEDSNSVTSLLPSSEAHTNGDNEDPTEDPRSPLSPSLCCNSSKHQPTEERVASTSDEGSLFIRLEGVTPLNEDSNNPLPSLEDFREVVVDAPQDPEVSYSVENYEERDIPRHPSATLIDTHTNCGDYTNITVTQGLDIQRDVHPTGFEVSVPHWSEYADPMADPMVPFCKFFSQNQCTHGAACKFRHSVTPAEYAFLFRDNQPPHWSLDTQSWHGFEGRRATVSAFGVCKFYPLGKCRNGSECLYDHIPSVDLLPAPQPQADFYNEERENSPSNQLEHHKQPCKYFMQSGNCARGSRCYFSHAAAGLEHDHQSSIEWDEGAQRHIGQQSPKDAQNPQSSEVGSHHCKWFQSSDGCKWGDKCKFLHEPPSVTFEETTSPPAEGGWDDVGDDDGWNTAAWGENIDEWTKSEETTQGDDGQRQSNPLAPSPKIVADCPRARCPYSVQGRCNKGTLCSFSHDDALNGWGDDSYNALDQDVKHDDQWPAEEDDPWTIRKPTCPFNARGYCKKGNQCNFSHDSPKSTLKDGNPKGATRSAPTFSRSPAPPRSENRKSDSVDGNVETAGWGVIEEATKAVPQVTYWPDSESENDCAPWALPKKPICDYYLAGKCRKMERCTFRHEGQLRNSEEETPSTTVMDEATSASRPDIEEAINSMTTQPLNDDDETWSENWSEEVVERSTTTKIPEPCKAFGQGHCPFNNDECMFLHVRVLDPLILSSEELITEDAAADPNDDARSDVTETPIPEEALEEEGLEAFNGGVSNEPTPIGIEAETSTERAFFRCIVHFGHDNGCSPSNVAAPSDSHHVIVSNLPPDVSHGEAVELVEVIDGLSNKLPDLIDYTTSEIQATITFGFHNPRDALTTIIKLHGQTFDSRVLTARLTTELVMPPLEPRTVKIIWPSPVRSAWAYYSTITAAKTHAKRLDGLTFIGRKITSTFFRPRPTDKTYAVRISGLLVGVEKPAVEELAVEAMHVHMNGPTYVEDPLDNIRGMLYARGSMEQFYRLPLDPVRPKHMAFMRFDDALLDDVMELHGMQQEYIGDEALTLQQVFHANYKLYEPEYEAVGILLEELRQTFDAHCTLRTFNADTERQVVDVHLYADVGEQEAFGAANRAVQDVLHGEVVLQDMASSPVPLWDEYFDLASSARALSKINSTGSFYIKLDHRRQLIRILGSEPERAKGQVALTRLLKLVRAQRHVVKLDLEGLRWVLDSGYINLQREIGENKVVLDVFASELVIRGDNTDLQKAREALVHASSAAAAAAASRQGNSLPPTATTSRDRCPVCRRAARDAVKLSCTHVYCMTCLQHVLLFFASPSSSTYVPPRCLLGCPEYIPYPIVRDVLPTAAEELLLRKSFISHVRMEERMEGPGRLFFCPTMDCDTVYRALEKKADRAVGVGWRCLACSVRICGRCEEEYHEGTECLIPARDMVEETEEAYEESIADGE